MLLEARLPLELPPEELRQLSLRGCVWAVARAQLRPALQRASSNGIPAYAVHPSGWSAAADGADCGEGVVKVSYSDHCSYLELVQFLLCLPPAPVTLLTPLPQPGSKFGYDGMAGMLALLHDASVQSIGYTEASLPVRRRKPARPPKRRGHWLHLAVRLRRRTVAHMGMRRRGLPCHGLRMHRSQGWSRSPTQPDGREQ